MSTDQFTTRVLNHDRSRASISEKAQESSQSTIS